MTTWEIRFANQEPVRVEIEPDRNLVEEYSAFEAFHHANRFRFWNRPSPFWQVTDSVVVHKDMVVGVVPRRPRTPRSAIGFT